MQLAFLQRLPPASWVELGGTVDGLAVRRRFAAILRTFACTPAGQRPCTLRWRKCGLTGLHSAWRRLIEESRSLPDSDKLNKVNTFFNRRMLFEDDIVVWQQADYWATPLEFMGRGSGDCEDFTIAKYITLQMLGIGNERLRLIYVRAKSGSTASIAHMVLGFYPQPTAEPLILDNLISSVRPASQRTDLSPVFSFNAAGLWVGGATTSSADPTTRLSRWRDVLERMRQDGL